MKKNVLITIFVCLAGCGLMDPPETSTPKYDFPEQGIVDFLCIEGIAPGISTEPDVIEAHGQPQATNAQSGYFYYYYSSKGIKVNFHASDSVVAAVYAYGSGWSYSIPKSDDTISGTFSRYAESTSLGLKLNDPLYRMDSVLAWYGQPQATGTLHEKSVTSVYPRYFSYAKDTLDKSFTMRFFFMSTGVQEYSGLPVVRINIYDNTAR